MTNEGTPLRILHVNKFHFLNGGAELYYLGLCDLFEGHGHTIGHFSMKHPENLPSPQSDYFIDRVDYENPGGALGKMKIAAQTVYGWEARRHIERLLDAESYDVVHLHNFHHQITPSILPAIKKRGIPIVMTVQDFKIVCPNYKMLTHDGVCERCKGHHYYQATVHRCNKGSLAGSLVNTVEMYVHHWLGYIELYDQFLAPAHFTGNKIVEFGVPKEKVQYVPNFVHVDEYEPQYEPGGYLLYLGRLSSEKGVPTLVEAMRDYPDTPLKITGRGPYEDEIRNLVQESGTTNLKLTGHLSGDALRDAIRGAKAVLIPSEWYENCPLALIEAYAYGKPVIGAKIGGLGEMVIDGKTGFQFEAGNAAGLSHAIGEALADEDRIRTMGQNARRRAEEEYDAGPQYEMMIKVYRDVIARSTQHA